MPCLIAQELFVPLRLTTCRHLRQVLCLSPRPSPSDRGVAKKAGAPAIVRTPAAGPP